ncbi:MAG: SUV3 C-terminal domain-containing protein, partial [Streptococcus thermophilus]
NYFIQDQDELPKPYQKEESLRTLETYYQKVNLYYSFCKNFDIPFDLDWVYEERLRVSERINEFLVNGKY